MEEDNLLSGRQLLVMVSAQYHHVAVTNNYLNYNYSY